MRKISNLDSKLNTITEDENGDAMPTRRLMLQGLGNMVVSTADEARRVTRLLLKIREKKNDSLTLENEDLAFIERCFEKNSNGLPAWAQGQILQFLAEAERVES